MPLIEDEMMEPGAEDAELEEGAPAAPDGAEAPVPAEEAAAPEEVETDASSAEDPAAGEPPSPQEQAAYDKVVLAGLKLLHDEKSHANIVQMLKTRAEEPAEALADTAAMLIQQIDKASKGTIPQAVVLPAATELLAEVATIAKVSGAFDAPREALAHAAQLMILAIAQTYGVDKAELEDFMKTVDVEKIKASMQKQPAPGAQPQPASGAQPQPAEEMA